MRERRWAVGFVLVVGSCKAAPRADTARPVPAAAPAPSSPPSGANGSASVISRSPSYDASPSTCSALRGPIALPIKAAPALAVRGETLDVALNEDGSGRIFSFPMGQVPPSVFSPRETAAGGRSPAVAVPCALAGDRLFCPDRSGAVHRTARGAGEDRVVASSRSGSRIAAATLGGAHTAVAYLASRKTTEGWVSEAWIAVDDEPPSRVSDDGSGATAVALAPHGTELIALTVDARMALTTMHARPVAYERHVTFGEDTVVFVGGPGERHTAAALVVPQDAPAWCLLPIARDVGSFGLAVVRLDAQPRVDEPVVWSMYPNGLDPAPVAAASGKGRVWAARVRPETAQPTSRRALELGQLDSEGAFVAREMIRTTGDATEVTLVVDARGAVWLGWMDGGGTWLEELACK